jgi:hypothetical protein
MTMRIVVIAVDAVRKAGVVRTPRRIEVAAVSGVIDVIVNIASIRLRS